MLIHKIRGHSLEQNPNSHLQLPLRSLPCPRHQPKVPIRRVPIRIRKLRSIRNIESLSTKLRLQPLRQRQRLEDRNITLHIPRPIDRITSYSAILSGSWLEDRARIEPPITNAMRQPDRRRRTRTNTIVAAIVR